MLETAITATNFLRLMSQLSGLLVKKSLFYPKLFFKFWCPLKVKKRKGYPEESEIHAEIMRDLNCWTAILEKDVSGRRFPIP